MNEVDTKRLADELEKRKDSGHELDGFERVDVKTPRVSRNVFSLRLSGAEVEVLESAAKLTNQTMGQFIRNAALAHAKRTVGNEAAFLKVDEALTALLDGLDDLGLRRKASA